MLNDALDEELRVETPWTLAGLNPNVAYQNVAFRKGDLACIDAPQEVTVNDGDVQRSATVVETPLVSLLERKRDNRKWRSIAVLVGARLAIDWGPKANPSGFSIRPRWSLDLMTTASIPSLASGSATTRSSAALTLTSIETRATTSSTSIDTPSISTSTLRPSLERVTLGTRPRSFLISAIAPTPRMGPPVRIPIRFVAAVASGPTRKSRTDWRNATVTSSPIANDPAPTVLT